MSKDRIIKEQEQAQIMDIEIGNDSDLMQSSLGGQDLWVVINTIVNPAGYNVFHEVCTIDFCIFGLCKEIVNTVC